MGEVDWHNPPQRLLVLWLSGEVEFETSDGHVRRLPAESVVLAEDTSGKGHRHPPEGQLVVHVALADHQSFARSASDVGTSRHFTAT
jgi:quercetin dioxygenase-like cupin family protein